MNKKSIIAELDNIYKLIDNQLLEIQQFETYAPLFKSIRQKSRKVSNKPKICIYPGCSCLSIKKSHAIAKSNSLRVIAEDGHVLQPFFDIFGSSFKLSMEPIGINNASTFPGFCETHEKLFHTFENTENVNDDAFAQLQAYRAICREIVHLNIEIEIIQKEIDEYINRIERESLNIINKNLEKRGFMQGVSKFNYQGTDKILFLLHGMKHDFEIRLPYLRESSKRILYEYINQIEESDRKTIYYGVSIDYLFPISLCGYTALAYGCENIKKMLFTTNIIPINNLTYLFCYADMEHYELFNKIVEFYFQSPLTILSFIESFMVYGSDHWYINPNYWKSFSHLKQEMILAEILNADKLFIDEFEYSIFDEIRKLILFEYEKHAAQFSEIDLKIVEKEKCKLTNILTYVPPTEDQLIKKFKNYWEDKLKKYKEYNNNLS